MTSTPAVVLRRDGWRLAARVILVLAALTLVVLAASGAWLWFDYSPAESQWVRDVHRAASVVVAVLAFAMFVIAVVRRSARRAPGVVASLGVLVTVGAAVVTGRLLPWDNFLLWAVTVGNDAAGVRGATGSAVKFVVIDGRAISPSTYEVWAYAHLALGVLVAGALVLAWLRTRDIERVRT